MIHVEAIFWHLRRRQWRMKQPAFDKLKWARSSLDDLESIENSRDRRQVVLGQMFRMILLCTFPSMIPSVMDVLLIFHFKPVEPRRRIHPEKRLRIYEQQHHS